MPVPTSISELSTTADDNSPAGTDSAKTADNFLRAHASFIAELRDGRVLIDRAYAEYTANANLTATIPGDDTIPQNTEGTQILSVSFTPKSTTNRLRLRFQGQVTTDVAGQAVVAAIFSSASASALKTTYVNAAGSSSTQMAAEYEYVPGTTSTLTFTVRVGPTAAANVRMNGSTASRLFGGTLGATLVIEEIAP